MRSGSPTRRAARLPCRIAGPLYSTSGPAGFYGEVDWSGTFAWSAATGARQDSVQLSDEALAEPESQIP